MAKENLAGLLYMHTQPYCPIRIICCQEMAVGRQFVSAQAFALRQYVVQSGVHHIVIFLCNIYMVL